MRYLNRMLKLKYVLDISDSASRARQRMAFAGLSFLIVFFLAPGGAIVGSSARMVFMIALGVYFHLAWVQSWLISNRERHWEKIELPSYCIDLPLIGWGLAVAAEFLAPVSPLIAVVALIRGIRYGPCMLACHIGLGIAIVLGLTLFVPYWQGHLELVYANLFLLLVLPVQFYGVSVKIQASSKSLRQENLTDPLTRSLNRKALEAAVWRMLNAKDPFVLSFLDLDNFKMVNDTLGHAVGNSRQEMAENLGQRIRAAIAEAIDYTCPDLPVSASVGVLQVLAFEDVSLEKLLARADQLMYQAKKTGKNQVLVATL